VTSLPSYGGVGDFGPAAYEFIDFLAAAKQRLWQVLPLSPTGYGSSPYSALSAFAGNPVLISLERLVQDGWLAPERLEGLPGHDGPADFGAAATRKVPLIEESRGQLPRHGERRGARPLPKVLYRQSELVAGLCDVQRPQAQIRLRELEQVACGICPAQARRAHFGFDRTRRELAIEQAVQYFFDEQWCSLRTYCKARDIRVLGDVAIFVNYDSADVWTHRELFELDDEGRMIRVSGVPPDYFSATGQRWGNPLYKWGEMREREFSWWVGRVRRTLALYDMFRLDPSVASRPTGRLQRTRRQRSMGSG